MYKCSCCPCSTFQSLARWESSLTDTFAWRIGTDRLTIRNTHTHRYVTLYNRINIRLAPVLHSRAWWWDEKAVWLTHSPCTTTGRPGQDVVWPGLGWAREVSRQILQVDDQHLCSLSISSSVFMEDPSDQHRLIYIHTYIHLYLYKAVC